MPGDWFKAPNKGSQSYGGDGALTGVNNRGGPFITPVGTRFYVGGSPKKGVRFLGAYFQPQRAGKQGGVFGVFQNVGGEDLLTRS